MNGPSLPGAYVASPAPPPNPNWTQAQDQPSPQELNGMSSSFSPYTPQQGVLVGNGVGAQQFGQVIPQGPNFVSPYLSSPTHFCNPNIPVVNANNVQQSGVVSQVDMIAMQHGMHYGNGFQNQLNVPFAGTNWTQQAFQYPVQHPLVGRAQIPFQQLHQISSSPFVNTMQAHHLGQGQYLDQGQFLGSQQHPVQGQFVAHGQNFNHGEDLSGGGQNFGHGHSLDHGQSFNHIQNLNHGHNFNYDPQSQQAHLPNVDQSEHQHLIGQHVVEHIPNQHVTKQENQLNRTKQSNSVQQLNQGQHLSHFEQSQLHEKCLLNDGTYEREKALLPSGPQLPDKPQQADRAQQAYGPQLEVSKLVDENILPSEDTEVCDETLQQEGGQLPLPVLPNGEGISVDGQEQGGAQLHGECQINDSHELYWNDFLQRNTKDLFPDPCEGEELELDLNKLLEFPLDKTMDVKGSDNFIGNGEVAAVTFDGPLQKTETECREAKYSNVAIEFDASSLFEDSGPYDALEQKIECQDYDRVELAQFDQSPQSNHNQQSNQNQQSHQTSICNQSQQSGQVQKALETTSAVSEPGLVHVEILPSMDPTGLAGAIGLTLEEFREKVHGIRRAEMTVVDITPSGLNSRDEPVEAIIASSQVTDVGGDFGAQTCASGFEVNNENKAANYGISTSGIGFDGSGCLRGFMPTNDSELGIVNYGGRTGSLMTGTPEISEFASRNASNGLGEATEGKKAKTAAKKAAKNAPKDNPKDIPQKAPKNTKVSVKNAPESQQQFSREDFAQAFYPYAQNLVRGFAQPPTQGFAQVQAQGFAQAPIQAFTQNSAQGFAQAPIQAFTQNSAQGFAQAPIQGLAQNLPQGFVQNPAQGFAQNPAQGFAQNPAQGLAQYSAQNFTQNPLHGFVQNHAQSFAQPPNLGFSQNPYQGVSQLPNQGLSLNPTFAYSNVAQGPNVGYGPGHVAYGGHPQMLSGNSQNPRQRKKSAPRKPRSGIQKFCNKPLTEKMRKQIEGKILQFLIDHKLTVDSNTEMLVQEAREAYETGNWAEYESKALGDEEDNTEDGE